MAREEVPVNTIRFNNRATLPYYAAHAPIAVIIARRCFTRVPTVRLFLSVYEDMYVRLRTSPRPKSPATHDPFPPSSPPSTTIHFFCSLLRLNSKILVLPFTNSIYFPRACLRCCWQSLCVLKQSQSRFEDTRDQPARSGSNNPSSSITISILRLSVFYQYLQYLTYIYSGRNLERKKRKTALVSPLSRLWNLSRKNAAATGHFIILIVLYYTAHWTETNNLHFWPEIDSVTEKPLLNLPYPSAHSQTAPHRSIVPYQPRLLSTTLCVTSLSEYSNISDRSRYHLSVYPFKFEVALAVRSIFRHPFSYWSLIDPPNQRRFSTPQLLKLTPHTSPPASTNFIACDDLLARHDIRTISFLNNLSLTYIVRYDITRDKTR